MAFDYKGWLKTAEDRVEALKKERATYLTAIDDEIAKLEAGIKAFAPLVEEHSSTAPEMGLTETVRQIFIESGNNLLAPTGIRDEVVRRGVALKQQNPMATIHQILSRLADKKFAEEVVHQGQKYYRWTGQMSLSDSMRMNMYGANTALSDINKALAAQIAAVTTPALDLPNLGLTTVADLLDPIVKEGKK